MKISLLLVTSVQATLLKSNQNDIAESVWRLEETISTDSEVDCESRLQEVDTAIVSAFTRMNKSLLVRTDLTLKEVTEMKLTCCAIKNEEFNGFAACLSSATSEPVFTGCFAYLQA